MKNFISRNHKILVFLSFLLMAFLFNTNVLFSQNSKGFKHIATQINTVNNYTIIDNLSTNNSPDKILFISHDYGTGPYVNSPIGVWYTNGKWSIFQQNRKPLGLGVKFNVLVKSSKDSGVFTHKATNISTSGHVTTIDHPSINNNPKAIIMVTQNWSTTGPYNANPIGVYYSGGKWRIYNQNKVKMPLNARFNVLVNSTNSFRHTASSKNMQSTHVTKLNHNLCNANPDALIFVTQYWTSVYNNHPIGVWYSKGKWTIYNEDKVKMPQSSKFNVLVISKVKQSSNTDEKSLCTEFGEQYARGVGMKNYKKGEVGSISSALAASTNSLWPVGKSLTVSMDNAASQNLKTKIINMANEWSIYANISFRLVTSNGDIHVKFDPQGGHRSLIGNQSVDWATRTGYDIISMGTMNLQVNADTPEPDLRRVVLHEFGHALGFKHEHQNPSVSIPWDKEKVYEYYRIGNGWDRGKVDHNLFDKLDIGQTQYTSFDPNSIMLYAIPNSLTIGNFSTSMNRRLSNLDKSFAQVLYPFPNSLGNKIRATITTGADDLREKSNANLIIKYRDGSAVKEFQTSLNRGGKWDNYSTHSNEIPLPTGIGINDIVSITLFFGSGKRVFTDEDDSWKINNLKLEYVDTHGNAFPMMEELEGNPYYLDFDKKNNPYLEFTFN